MRQYSVSMEYRIFDKILKQFNISSFFFFLDLKVLLIFIRVALRCRREYQGLTPFSLYFIFYLFIYLFFFAQKIINSLKVEVVLDNIGLEAVSGLFKILMQIERNIYAHKHTHIHTLTHTHTHTHIHIDR